MGISLSVPFIRSCISPDPCRVPGMESFLNMCKSLFDTLTNRQDVKIVGCYSYDLIPHAGNMKTAAGTESYILIDMHISDYYFDFQQLTSESLNLSDSFFYKYMSEIEARKGEYVYSAFYKQMYSNVTKFRSIREEKGLWRKSMFSTILAFLHEMCHAYPEIMPKSEFKAMFDAARNSLREQDVSIYRDITDKLIEECYCDFSALVIANVTDMFIKHFGLSKQELFELYFQMLASTSIINILNNTTVDRINKGDFSFSRLELSRLEFMRSLINYVSAQFDFFGGIDTDQAFVKSLTVLRDFAKYIADTLIFTIQKELDKYLIQVNIQEVALAGKKKHENQKEKAWIHMAE